MEKLSAAAHDFMSVENFSNSKTFDSRKPDNSIISAFSKAAVTFTNQLLTRVDMNSKICSEE